MNTKAQKKVVRHGNYVNSILVDSRATYNENKRKPLKKKKKRNQLKWVLMLERSQVEANKKEVGRICRKITSTFRKLKQNKKERTIIHKSSIARNCILRVT